jgi:hypothetical protein
MANGKDYRCNNETAILSPEIIFHYQLGNMEQG